MKLVRMLKRNALDAVIAVFLFFVSIVMLYPLLETVAVSLSTPESLVYRPTLMWWPVQFSTVAYPRILEQADVLTGYKNTIWLICVGVTVNLTMSGMLAFFWSRKDYDVKLKPIIIMMIFITNYVGGSMISDFILRRGLGLSGTKWVMIIGRAISTYNTILLMSYFKSAIPSSIDDSVHLDGGGHFTLLFRIYMPLAKPSLAVIGMYYGLGYWGEWFEAKIYLQDSKDHPLALILRNIMLRTQVVGSDQMYAEPRFFTELNETLTAALCVISTLPFMLIYPLLQKYFQGGIMVGSIKG